MLLHGSIYESATQHNAVLINAGILLVLTLVLRFILTYSEKNFFFT